MALVSVVKSMCTIKDATLLSKIKIKNKDASCNLSVFYFFWVQDATSLLHGFYIIII
jgi:hypothetical protein